MVEIFKLLKPQHIKLELDSKRKKGAIVEMIELVSQSGALHNTQKIIKEIIQREKEGTTGIGGGIAIPHVMSKTISQTVMAFGRKKEGLEFDAIDAQPVQLIFLLIGPTGKESRHLRVLCKLSRLLHNPQLKEALLNIDSKEAAVKLFQEQERAEG